MYDDGLNDATHKTCTWPLLSKARRNRNLRAAVRCSALGSMTQSHHHFIYIYLFSAAHEIPFWGTEFPTATSVTSPKTTNREEGTCLWVAPFQGT